MRDRNAARIDLVELIITDSDRAQRVKNSYQQMTDLIDGFAATRTVHAKRFASLSSERVLPEAELRAEIATLRQSGRDAYQDYVRLQLDIRKHTTAKEFARLDEAR